MNHVDIEGATHLFGAPSDLPNHVGQLSVRMVNVQNVDPTTEQVTDFGPFMVSKWMPSEEELKQLNAGEGVNLWIRGTTHPVVRVTVGVDNG